MIVNELVLAWGVAPMRQQDHGKFDSKVTHLVEED